MGNVYRSFTVEVSKQASEHVASVPTSYAAVHVAIRKHQLITLNFERKSTFTLRRYELLVDTKIVYIYIYSLNTVFGRHLRSVCVICPGTLVTPDVPFTPVLAFLRFFKFGAHNAPVMTAA